MIRRSLRAALLLPAAAAAQPAPAPPEPPHISVSGSATVTSPPDRATLNWTVHGEGATSDEAVRAVAAKRAAIDGGIARLAARGDPRAGQVNVHEVRGRDCRPRYDAPQLSTGECAIVGYTADLSVELRTGAVADAGTIVGLVARAGGTDPRVNGFDLVDDRPAQRRATVAALADARDRAAAVAEGMGVRLGPLRSASDGYRTYASEEIIVTARRVSDVPPPPPPPPPPVPLGLKPRPIETRAQVTVVYDIAR